MACRAWCWIATAMSGRPDRHRRHGGVRGADRAAVASVLAPQRAGVEERRRRARARAAAAQLLTPIGAPRGAAGARGPYVQRAAGGGRRRPAGSTIRAAIASSWRRLICRRRARAGCLQLRRRLGHHRAVARCARGAVRGLLGGRAGRGGAQRRRQRRALGTQRGDAFEVLDELQRRGERFDAVVLDPPAFIKRKKDIPRGQAAYRKLNQLGDAVARARCAAGELLVLLSPGAEELLGLIQSAARTPAASCRCSTAAASRPITRCTRRSRRRAI
jgi:hypothetical protein